MVLHSWYPGELADRLSSDLRILMRLEVTYCLPIDLRHTDRIPLLDLGVLLEELVARLRSGIQADKRWNDLLLSW